jgi:hypothetical protein
MLRPLGTFYGHFVIWWQFGIFSTILVKLCQEKSGNSGEEVEEMGAAE